MKPCWPRTSPSPSSKRPGNRARTLLHGILRDSADRPVARRRRLPAHDDAVRRRAALLDSRPRACAVPRQAHLPGRPEGRRERRPGPRRHLHDGMRGEHRAEPAAAGRQREGPRRGRRPRPDGRMEGGQGVLSRRRQGAGPAERAGRERRGRDEQGRVPVRAVREAVEQPAARRDDRRRARGRPEQARRHDRRPPRRRRGREAEPARDHLAARAPDPHRQHPRGRGRQAPGGPPHPVSRQEADGEGAEGVLPQREDEGDPEGAGPQGGAGQRGGRPAEEDSQGPDAPRRRGGRRCRS